MAAIKGWLLHKHQNEYRLLSLPCMLIQRMQCLQKPLRSESYSPLPLNFSKFNTCTTVVTTIFNEIQVDYAVKHFRLAHPLVYTVV